MKTENFNATNLDGLTPDLVSEIEAMLGREIYAVVSLKNGFEDFFRISPDEPIYANNYPCTCFRPFFHNKDYKFDYKTGILSLKGRNKYERNFKQYSYRLEIVGYKLNTTHRAGGYVWGSPVLIDNK